MGILFFLISIILLLIAVIGLILPRLTKQSNRKSVLLKFLLPSFLSFITSGYFVLSDSSELNEPIATTPLSESSSLEKNEIVAVLESEKETDEEKEAKLKALKENEDKKALEKAEKEAKEKAELKQKQEDKLNDKRKAYVEQLNREMDSLKTFSVKKYLESKDSIILGVALFSVWATIAEEGETFDLNKNESELLKKFKAKISSVQSRSFPKLRDSYGPAIRQNLWEHDLSAKTNGKGYRNLEFVGAAFAANRNIKQFQETISNVVHQLRFKKVKYRWYKGASEFTFYDVKSHNDRKLIIWTEGDRFREVK